MFIYFGAIGSKDLVLREYIEGCVMDRDVIRYFVLGFVILLCLYYGYLSNNKAIVMLFGSVFGAWLVGVLMYTGIFLYEKFKKNSV